MSAYLIVCSVFLTIFSFKGVFDGSAPVKDKLLSLFNSTNGVLVAAVASTIGIYFFASFLYVRDETVGGL